MISLFKRKRYFAKILSFYTFLCKISILGWYSQYPDVVIFATHAREP